MNYQEQLSDPRWKEKRKVIINRDSWKCQSCGNESYKNKYQIGLVLSDKSAQGIPKGRCRIFDSKSCRIVYAFTNNMSFSSRNSYIAIYKKERIHAQLLALRIIDEVKIKAKVIFSLEEWRNGLTNIVSEIMDKEIYKPEKKDDKWAFVLGLHVHHKYYQNGLMAWEYPDDALVTLCWECHEKLHSDTVVPVLDSNRNETGKFTPCRRCFGAGSFPEYIHVQAGICFRCRGAKYEELIL